MRIKADLLYTPIPKQKDYFNQTRLTKLYDFVKKKYASILDTVDFRLKEGPNMYEMNKAGF